MIIGQYMVRSYQEKVYYLNLRNFEDISYSPPKNYGKDIEIEKKPRKIRLFILHITDKCNLKCSYCFENNSEIKRVMKSDKVEKLIEFINVSDKVDDEISIRFFGGEPFLRTNFIKNAIVKMENNILDKKINYNVFTNATLLNESIEKLLDEYPITIFVSIDGDMELHDLNRKYHNGKGSHKIVEKNLKKFIEKYDDRIITRSVISITSYSTLEKRIEYLNTLGVKKLSFTLPWGEDLVINDEIKDTISEAKKTISDFFEDFYNRILNHDFQRVGVHPFSSMVSAFIDGNVIGLDSRSCGSGYESLSIGSNGNIYPCHSFVYDESFKIGDIMKGKIDLTNLIGLMTSEDIPSCLECDMRYLCKSRCLADNYYSNNDLENCTNYKCEIEHHIFDEVCGLILKLKSKEKRMMQIITNQYNLKDV